MTIKANENGTFDLTCSAKGVCGTANNNIIGCTYDTAWNTVATMDSVKSVIDEITKKPEVRPEQRSALEVTNKVVAKFYKDGFFTGSQTIIPAIKSIDVFNNNTIKMAFVNGDVQKVTVRDGDTFSFEDGVLRCIVQEMLGNEGGSVLNKLLAYATKVYKDAEENKKKKAEEEEKKRVAAEKNYKKLQKHWEKKRAMEREKRIQEMAEAIVRAKEMKKNV